MTEDKECPFCDGPLIRAEDLVACGNHLCGIGHLWMTAEQWNRRAAKPAVPESYTDYQQRRGAHADIVDEAIAAYEQWLLDDHYDAHGALTLIIERMRERRALYAAPPLPVAQGVPENFVLMPKALTADNGAKAALIGEFHEVIEVTCPECDGACEDCDHCQESGTVAQQVTVGWDTIKAIYCKAVELLAAHTPPGMRCE